MHVIFALITILKEFFRKFITSQFRRNLLSGSIVHGINALVIMLSYPIYIKYLGFELFSVWALLSVVISFAIIGELGISRAIIVFSAKAKASNDIEEIKRVVSASIIIITIPASLIFIILWNWHHEITLFLEVPNEHRQIASITVKYIGGSIFTYIVYDVLSGIISGLGRLDITNSLLLFSNITKVLISFVFLALGFSMLSLVYSILITNLIFILIAILVIINRLNINILSFILPREHNIKSLMRFGSSVVGMQLLNIFSSPFVKIVLVRSVGLEAVGVFELASKAGYSIRTLVEKGLFAIMPEIAYIIGMKKSAEVIRDSIYQTAKKVTLKLIIFVVPAMMIVILMAPFWLNWWLGNTYSMNILFGFWLLQPGIIIGLIALPSFYSLMAAQMEQYCLIEALIRTVFLITFSGLFLLFNMQVGYLYFFFGVSVSISNIYIILLFKKKFQVIQ
jgi:O-antigen/teichoic acid export membrane protein